MRAKPVLLRNISTLNGVLASFAVTIVFAGCGMLDSTNNANSESNRATPAPTQAAVSTSPTPPAAAPASSGPAIATADGDLPGIRVEVQELKRTSGDTVTLKFAMINDSDKEFDVGILFGEEGKSSYDFYSIGGVHMIDPAGKKKYFVVRDTENQCLCSRNVKNIGSKSRVPLWAKFPAPPGDVQKITLVIPHFIPMDDVPIGQ